ncbi:MAG: 3-isopropylmalate dehydrogenase, partial [Desulfovibrionales bacterium]|nr:3-isopropylmalate dehydrogenase [Desulfovibrionales bacterium]
MNIKICLLPGDGIGPEIITQAVRVLEKTATHFTHTIETQTALIGGVAIDAVGEPLPKATIAAC